MRGLIKAAKKNIFVFVIADGNTSQCLSKEFIKHSKNHRIHFRYFEQLLLWKLKQINDSKQVKTRKDILEDYINQPKKSGYLSPIHILADMSYDAVVKDNNSKKVHP